MVKVVQVVLPLALPGQVHQGGPLGPPQLHQPPILINAPIVAWNLHHPCNIQVGFGCGSSFRMVDDRV